MSPRQRWIYAGALVALVGLYWVAVFRPLATRLEDARRDLVAAHNRASEAALLSRLHERLQPLLGGVAGDVNLVTKLDQLVRAKGLKDRVVQMQSKPVAGPAGSRTQESALLRLDRLDLTQLHATLAALSGLPRNVWVRKMEIRRMGKDEAQAVLEIDEFETK